MCLGCLFALFAATFPRLAFLIMWAFTNWVEIAFKGNWFLPLLGVIFAPFTALMYVLVSLPAGGISLGGWLLVGLAVLADIAHWGQLLANRENGVALYNQYNPAGTQAPGGAS
jgi:hypothetical protein